MPISGMELDALNRKVNKLVGLKQYQHIKKVMQEFDAKLQQEMEKAPKVDQKQ
jgi:hypothetical protein